MSLICRRIFLIIITIFLIFSLPSGFNAKDCSIKPIDETGITEGLFDSRVKSLMKLGGLPSISACLVKNNSVVWCKAFGFADLENITLARPETLYCIGSIHKSITATAILQLYERNDLDIYEDINQYLPYSLRNPNHPEVPITVEMLLSHRSSIARDPDSMENLSYTNIREYLVPNGSLYSPAYWNDYKPDEEFEYSNLNYVVLDYILELVSNQSIHEYFQENIYTPLGMNQPGVGYNRNFSAVPYWRSGLKLERIENETYKEWFEHSSLDLSHFLIAHMNGGLYNGTRILNESTVALMHSIKSFRPEISNFFNGLSYQGLGWDINIKRNGEIFEGHNGVVPGASAVMKYKSVNGEKVGVILFTNVMTLIPVYNFRGYIATLLIERLLFKMGEQI